MSEILFQFKSVANQIICLQSRLFLVTKAPPAIRGTGGSDKQDNINIESSLVILQGYKLYTRTLYNFIIQQIITLSKYGQDALDFCHP